MMDKLQRKTTKQKKHYKVHAIAYHNYRRGKLTQNHWR